MPAGEVIREGFDATCDRDREHLRREIGRRLREVAKGARVEVACDCGETVDVSAGYAEKVSAKLVSAPRCFECTRPARAAQAEAEAVKWVELVGDSAEELAAAVAALS